MSLDLFSQSAPGGLGWHEAPPQQRCRPPRGCDWRPADLMTFFHILLFLLLLLILYDIISYHIILYYIILYCIILSYIISYYIISYHIISYHIISYCIILSYIISYYIILYHIILYHIILYCIISYHIILYYIILYYTIFPLLSSSFCTSKAKRRSPLPFLGPLVFVLASDRRLLSLFEHQLGHIVASICWMWIENQRIRRRIRNNINFLYNYLYHITSYDVILCHSSMWNVNPSRCWGSDRYRGILRTHPPSCDGPFAEVSAAAGGRSTAGAREEYLQSLHLSIHSFINTYYLYYYLYI